MKSTVNKWVLAGIDGSHPRHSQFQLKFILSSMFLGKSEDFEEYEKEYLKRVAKNETLDKTPKLLCPIFVLLSHETSFVLNYCNFYDRSFPFR